MFSLLVYFYRSLFCGKNYKNKVKKKTETIQNRTRQKQIKKLKIIVIQF